MKIRKSITTAAATILAAIVLAGCVDEGRYYHVETRVEARRPNYDRGPVYRAERAPNYYRGNRPHPRPYVYQSRDYREYRHERDRRPVYRPAYY